MAPLFLSPHYNKAADLDISIAAIECRLQRRRASLNQQRERASNRLRGLLTSPGLYLLAVGAGFVLGEILGPRKRTPQAAKDRGVGPKLGIVELIAAGCLRTVGGIFAERLFASATSQSTPTSEAPPTGRNPIVG